MWPGAAFAETLRVGAAGYPTPCEAFAAANDGDTVEISAGTYTDMCEITKNGLTIRGVEGRPVVDARGSGAQGKGIWIVSGQDTTIENVELNNSAVPDENGAGIRMQGKNLTVRNSVFRNNENGILESNVADSEIVVERCEFDSNGDGKGYAHNMYIGTAKRFVLRESWSHGAKVGHLVKTRAAENIIEYNRLTGEDGTQSYELELTKGGRSFVIGNIIEQNATTENPGMLAYAQEGTGPGANMLFVAHNTFINHRPNGGTFVVVNASFGGEVRLVNNVFAGPGTITNFDAAAQSGSCSEGAQFVDEAGFDFHLVPGSACVDQGVDAGVGDGVSLAPTRQYVHPAASERRVAVGAPDPGAFEVGGGVPDGSSSGGASGSSGVTSSSGASGTSGSNGGGASGSSGASGGATSGSVPADEESGCAAAPNGSGALSALPLAALVGVLVFRARRRDAREGT